MDDYAINRTDGAGRSIYLQDRPASAPTVIFTGAPGMGKSYALSRATEAARRNGDLVFTIHAGSREPLEKRLARAVHDQYNELAETNGDRVLSDIGRLADRLLGVRGRWAERALTALAPVLRRAISWWEAPAKPSLKNPAKPSLKNPAKPSLKNPAKPSLKNPAKPSLKELVDRLGDLAQQRNKRLLLAVDNLGSRQQSDLADVAGLAEHLQSNGRPIQLVVGASAPAIDALLTTNSPVPAASIGTRYDIRDCAPISEAELRRALLASLHRQGAVVRADAATRLVHEANGDPGHLMALAEHAAASADSSRGVSRAVAEEAIRTKRSSDQWAYRASWARLSDDARVIVTSALSQAKGVALAEPSVLSDARALVDRARTVSELVDSGLLRRQGDRLRISDPGFRDWLSTTIAPHPQPSSARKPERGTKGTQQSKSSTASRSADPVTGAAQPGTTANKPKRSTTARAAGTSSATARPKARSASPDRRRTRVAGKQTRGVGRG